ncbi:zinc-dependent metalloprotease [Lewinella sp. IMCC34191]|uniref:zinc-dependent metalloprotease n=1 Tax=Lewinella sp. IMCC34191 TaxID=2259172 RepID=UPI000E258D6E|nr:zinc-dependent metalloprotease [Lewinella sp. IMCC34191]
MQFRYRLLLLGLVFFVCPLTAQLALPLDSSLEHRGCELPVVKRDVMYQRPYAFRKGVRPKNLLYTVDYREDGRTMFGDTCHAWPQQAKSALEYAISVWSDVLQNDRSIDIHACYSPGLPGGTLGAAQPRRLLFGPYMQDTVFISQALAEHLIDFEISDSLNPDIQIIINKNFDFYYGTDANPPGSQVDFVTLAIHELGHGLGFAGSARYDDGNPGNGTECAGTDSTGCIGYYVDFGHKARYCGTPYDLFADVGNDGRRALDLPNNSREMLDALLGRSGGILFDEGNSDTYFTGTNAHPLYTPDRWRQGSSYSHFQDPSEALYYALSYGSAVHDVGRASEVMQSIGWSKAFASFAILPVTLASFDAARLGPTVELTWQTGREVDHAYFVVEARRKDGSFQDIGRVEGMGTGGKGATYRFVDGQPSSGANYYRLRQVDHTGQEALSYVVGVRMQPTEVVIGNPFPNPNYGGTLYLDYESDADRNLTAYTLTATGRVMARYRLPVTVGQNRLTLDVSDHPAGFYTLLLGDGKLRAQRRFVLH